MDDAALSPGSIISIFGSNLTNTRVAAPAGTLPKTLGGVTLTIAGISSPLFYVSPTQVNAEIDPTVPPGPATITLTSPTGTVTANITITTFAAPGIFSLEGTGTHDAAVLNAVTFTGNAFSVTSGASPTFLAIFATGLDIASAPTVTIGGVVVPVVFVGNAPGFPGLQQINVQLVNALDGAGRVKLVVESHGKKSNVVEIVIVPKQGEGPFPSDQSNQPRSRELSSIAYIPNTSLALVADENDDVVRVVDAKQRQVVRTVVLPQGAAPIDIAVDAGGTEAVVAERDRGKVALINLSTFMVTTEVAAGAGPVSVAIAGSTALVANQDDRTVSVINLAATPPQVTATVTLSGPPSAIAADMFTNRAYVALENSGSISVIDIAHPSVISQVDLGANARPADIELIPGTGFAVVTEPSAGPNGQVVVVNLTTGASVSLNVNPSGSGGLGDLVLVGSTAYFTNQADGSVTVAPITFSGSVPSFSPTTTIKTGMGTRSLAVDTKDKLLLVINEGSGTITVIDLSNNQIAGTINAVLSSNPGNGDEDDDHNDRETAGNTPAITSLSPNNASSGSTFTMTINGSGFAGTTDVIFVDVNSHGDNGDHGDNDKGKGHGDDPSNSRDTGITTSHIVVNAAGTQLTATIQIAAGHPSGARLVRVLTPNGESSSKPGNGNNFNVNQGH